MGYKATVSIAIAASAISLALPASAKEYKPEQIMQATGECVYVVNVAESNGASLNHTSEEWAQLLLTFAERYGLEAKKYVDKAKAKHRKRSRVYGADHALNDMMRTARECDQELEGL